MDCRSKWNVAAAFILWGSMLGEWHGNTEGWGGNSAWVVCLITSCGRVSCGHLRRSSTANLFNIFSKIISFDRIRQKYFIIFAPLTLAMQSNPHVY